MLSLGLAVRAGSLRAAPLWRCLIARLSLQSDLRTLSFRLLMAEILRRRRVLFAWAGFCASPSGGSSRTAGDGGELTSFALYRRCGGFRLLPHLSQATSSPAGGGTRSRPFVRCVRRARAEARVRREPLPSPPRAAATPSPKGEAMCGENSGLSRYTLPHFTLTFPKIVLDFATI